MPEVIDKVGDFAKALQHKARSKGTAATLGSDAVRYAKPTKWATDCCAKRMKATQRNQLLKLIEQSGWQVRAIEGAEQLCAEWFIAELWEIESVWSPRGFRAFITFVVDPQSNFSDEHRWPGVWLVIASLQRPTSWGAGEGEVGLELNRGWQARLPEFLNGLNALRSGAITG